MKGTKKSVNIIDDLAPGEHLCAIFETDEEHRAVISDFIRIGLERQEKVVYVTDCRNSEAIAGYLRDDDIDIDPCLESGQLIFLTADEVYTTDGIFVPDMMLALIDSLTKKALSEGYSAFRGTAEMSWMLKGLPGSEKVIEYEARLNELIPRIGATILCQYDRRKFRPELLLKVLSTHPTVLLGTEIFENLYYMPPEEFFAVDVSQAMLNNWMQNLKERQRIEEELRINEERFRNVFEKGPIGIAMVDRNHRFINVNSTLCSMLGYTEAELTGMTFQEITHPDSVARDTEAAGMLYKGEIPVYRTEKRYIRKNSQTFWIDLTTTMTYDHHGRPLNHIAMIVDIDEKKRAWEKLEKLVTERTTELEEKNRLLRKEIDERRHVESLLQKERDVLHLSESRLAEAQRIAHLGNWDWNVVTNELYWSPEIYRIFGLEVNLFEATYTAFLERVHPEDREYVINAVNEAVLNRKPYSINHRIIRPDGSLRTVHEQGEVTFGGDGRALRMAGTVEDITTLKETEEKLRQSIVELERSNADLEHFAYVASHDLQEPLRMIGSFSQLIEQGYRDRLDEEGEEYLQFVISGAQRMQQLINDLLNFSRVATRAVPFTPVDFNIIMDNALRNLIKRVEKTNAVITCDHLPSIQADESQFIQVFQNLLSNAMKFRRKEPPRIHVSAAQLQEFWQFSVSDNGMGIDRDYFDKIFILFQRLNSLKKYHGTGIGLAICKKIVERHGGRIWVDSETGKGSTFFFTIPMKEMNTNNE